MWNFFSVSHGNGHTETWPAGEMCLFPCNKTYVYCICLTKVTEYQHNTFLVIWRWLVLQKAASNFSQPGIQDWFIAEKMSPWDFNALLWVFWWYFGTCNRFVYIVEFGRDIDLIISQVLNWKKVTLVEIVIYWWPGKLMELIGVLWLHSQELLWLIV